MDTATRVCDHHTHAIHCCAHSDADGIAGGTSIQTIGNELDRAAAKAKQAAEKLKFLKGTALRPYVTNPESIRL
jgi:hypothetical protein